MESIMIVRPRVNDIEALNKFFELMIRDTFAKEGLRGLEKEIQREVNIKIGYLKNDIATNGGERFFLIGKLEGKIIASIEHGPIGAAIKDCSNGLYDDHQEIGGVFVHPDYQGLGIGNVMLSSMYVAMISKGYEEFVLDSGYKRAQKIWLKKYGEPDLFIKDYWDVTFHHMIWKRRLSDVEIKFNFKGI